MNIVRIGHIQIKVSKLSEDYKYHQFPNSIYKDEEKPNYIWEHISGLGFLTPNYGYGFTEDEAIANAEKAIKDASLI